MTSKENYLINRWVLFFMLVMVCYLFVNAILSVDFTVYKHMRGVKVSANDFYDKFSCYPVRADSFSNPDVFRSSDGNSCKKSIIGDGEMKKFRFKEGVNVDNDKFKVFSDNLAFEGIFIETNNNKLVYKIHGLDKSDKKFAYSKCASNMNTNYEDNPVIINNEESVTEQNPCGVDEYNNPLIFIGETKINV